MGSLPCPHCGKPYVIATVIGNVAQRQPEGRAYDVSLQCASCSRQWRAWYIPPPGKDWRVLWGSTSFV